MVWQLKAGINNPLGLALTSDGTLLSVDFRDNVINRIDGDGEILPSWGRPGNGDGELAAPAGIAIDSTGAVYIADHDNYRVQKFSASGSFISAWGTRGSGDGQFDAPDGIAISPSGDVWVSEDRNARVQVFDPNGRFITKIDAASGVPFSDPTGITFSRGRAFVGDYGADRVWVLSTAGVLSGTIGRSGRGPGEFSGISFLATDTDGDVLVTSFRNGRIEEFDPDGTHLRSLVPAIDGLFAKPYGIATSPDGDLFISEVGAVDRVRRS